jgi:bacterioferritin
MKAKKGVVEFLNKVLTNELTAINQYFLHAEMCGNWGYTLLHNEMRKHAIDEMKHAEQDSQTCNGWERSRLAKRCRNSLNRIWDWNMMQ